MKINHKYSEKAIEDKFRKSNSKTDINNKDTNDNKISPQIVLLISAQKQMFAQAMADIFKHDRDKDKAVHFTKSREIP